MLCTRNPHSVVGQLYLKNKQTHRKRDQICGDQRWGWGEGGLEEGGPKVQTPSYKTDSCQGCSEQHDKENGHCCALQTQVVGRLNPKHSHMRKTNVSVSLTCLCEMTDVHYAYCGHRFMMCVRRIIMLCALHSYSAVCQLYLNKSERKNNKRYEWQTGRELSSYYAKGRNSERFHPLASKSRNNPSSF